MDLASAGDLDSRMRWMGMMVEPSSQSEKVRHAKEVGGDFPSAPAAAFSHRGLLGGRWRGQGRWDRRRSLSHRGRVLAPPWGRGPSGFGSGVVLVIPGMGSGKKTLGEA